MIENNASANARIIDRGYQHYDGTRLGLGHSEWVMLRAALLRGLGLRRNFRNKIMPWLLIAFGFLPPIIILGIQIILGQAVSSPYARLYPRVDVLFILFAGLVAADLICADRRERVISLYFSAPLTRLHYVAAQVIGLVLLLLLLTLLPYVILFFGQALLSPAFATFVSNNWPDLRSVVLGGTLIAFFYGALAMAVASFTDRRAYATGGFLGLVLVAGIAGGVLSSPRLAHFSGHEWFSLLDLFDMPIIATQWLLGKLEKQPLDGSAYLWWSVAVIVISLALVAWRYLKVSD
jgi:ABC-type transport system involved in multi-copper enzyme maturation permease subunit